MSISHSPEETEALAASWSQRATPGLVIGLLGELGAGKTRWARGFAKGLGYAGRVHSPTFALLNEYSGGRLPIYHLDLYRLENPEQVQGAGLEEYLPNRDGVTLVEWLERWLPIPNSNAPRQPLPPPYPPRFWLVHFELGRLDEPQSRVIVHEDFSR
jgi:tRNA threonylcarbamoyladenosine biosynthesis protein TsaE